MPNDIPVQPVERPILCSPYAAPSLHWEYDRATGEATKMAGRRPARYWYKTKEQVQGQLTLELVEGQDDLVTVNQLREDVARWRDSGWEGSEPITRELLRHWSSPERPRRLFFCQLEAAETVIYLAEILQSGRKPRFKPQFLLADLAKLTDAPANPDLLPLTRYGCKMATGSGKTVVMAMLIAWAFCNRGRNLGDERFPRGVLACCPNLTVYERLQVLRPERPDNYYTAFDIVPVKLRPLMQSGKVLVANWQKFGPESEHADGGKSFAVVNKGAETAEAFAQRVLGDLYERMPIMVLNDEAHHCYRPAPLEERLTGDEAKEAQADREEATVWIEGLDKINNAQGGRPAGQTKPGIRMCVDLSATPFYIKGSGHVEGSPFPWLVDDFGLVDAIESGIVKIPRLPVSDTTGRPEAKYFKLWQTIRDGLEPAEFLPGKAKKPKPDVVFREAEPALKQLAGQWVERFKYIQDARPGQVQIPPALIIVCDNVDIAEIFYRKISGEEPVEVATEEDVAAVEDEENGDDAVEASPSRKSKAKPEVSYGHGVIFPEHFANSPGVRHTLRIDSRTVEENEELRRIVATVGKRGEPGEHVRCVVAVMMLNEGWDANNVTHVLGIRAFTSQLLCEQVVGRGLRRMDYTPDQATGLLTEEYVDVYGIPFTVIPFKGRPVNKPEPDDKPKNHVRAIPERAHLEMRFPVVEGYAFALKRNLIKCDVGAMDPLVIEPNREPTATFLLPTVGYQEGTPSQAAPFGFIEQDREEYYRATHLQAIKFQIAQLVISHLVGEIGNRSDAKTRVWRLRSRHQLFPQVFGFVDEYARRKVNFRDADPRELGLEKYVMRMVGYLCDAIVPDEAEGEAPLLPVLNRYKSLGTTADVDFTTTRPCHGTQRSHINQVVLDTRTWEGSAAFRLESSDAVERYARNDHLGLMIPYEFQGVDHYYEPDFLVRLTNELNVVLEVKGFEDAQTSAKHNATRRWVAAVNNAREHGQWAFHVCRDPQVLDKELKWLLTHVVTAEAR
ncbi:MAG TPA: DEAD/DEAH box helicase family protein [Phycisphaerae bacterium]|nr:DEAD/DEAH box helicase family protein [Phycisphaerae bacterium]HNU45965.1 DEAD/DEAH box helicase family protein [Phycisphaerae bacterium]